MHDITKLPEWVQNKIRVLEADVEYTNKKLRQMIETEGEKLSNVAVRDGLSEYQLPEDSHIVFYGGKEKYSVRLEGKELIVSTLYGRLLIQPEASNHIRMLSEINQQKKC